MDGPPSILPAEHGDLPKAGCKPKITSSPEPLAAWYRNLVHVAKFMSPGVYVIGKHHWVVSLSRILGLGFLSRSLKLKQGKLRIYMTTGAIWLCLQLVGPFRGCHYNKSLAAWGLY